MNGYFDVGKVASLFDALPYYILVVDEDHRILFANKAVADTYDVQPEALIGKYCPQEIHKMDKSYPGCPLEEAREKGESVTKDMLFEDVGAWVRSAAYITDIRTEDGKKVFLHIVQDITERIEAENCLQTKINELEKWQRLTVGREIAMAELKRKIRDLEEEMDKLKKITAKTIP